MKQTLFLLFVLLNTEQLLIPAQAKDFGIHGHTFEIGEPDLLKHLMSKLKQWERQGKLSELNETLIERTQKSLSEPRPVEGITKATVARIFEYDPSIIVPYDLKDHEGRVFHKAGTKINPLKFHSLSQPLVFLDGTDKAQVLWVEKAYLKADLTTKPSPKIILIAGSPFKLMKKWQVQTAQDNPQQNGPDQNGSDCNDSTQVTLLKKNFAQAQPVYFDQGGVLTRKLDIRHVPAVVVQEGLKLKVSEIVVEEDVLEEGVQ
jgi:conjugal transfer pilus assembly protein TraW